MSAMESDAAALVALKDDYYAAVKVSGDAARTDALTGGHLDAVLSAGRAVDAACEDLRRRHFPRAYRVVAVQGEVFTVSKTARSVRCVYSAR